MTSDCASAYFPLCSLAKVLFVISASLLQRDSFIYRGNDIGLRCLAVGFRELNAKLHLNSVTECRVEFMKPDIPVFWQPTDYQDACDRNP